MNINRYALREERKIQKIISKMGPIDATAIGMCNENRITSNILMPFHDNHLPISVFVPKRKKGDYKKFPVIVDIYGGGFVAGRSEQNKHFGAWCAEHGYLTFIPEYSPGPESQPVRANRRPAQIVCCYQSLCRLLRRRQVPDVSGW